MVPNITRRKQKLNAYFTHLYNTEIQQFVYYIINLQYIVLRETMSVTCIYYTLSLSCES